MNNKGRDEIEITMIATNIGYILFLRHLVISCCKYSVNIKEQIYCNKGATAIGIGVGSASVDVYPKLCYK